MLIMGSELGIQFSPKFCKQLQHCPSELVSELQCRYICQHIRHVVVPKLPPGLIFIDWLNFLHELFRRILWVVDEHVQPLSSGILFLCPGGSELHHLCTGSHESFRRQQCFCLFSL